MLPRTYFRAALVPPNDRLHMCVCELNGARPRRRVLRGAQVQGEQGREGVRVAVPDRRV